MSYLARLRCADRNAAKHGLVPVANQYPSCSAAWFERTASPAMVKSAYRFRVGQVQAFDEFAPIVGQQDEAESARALAHSTTPARGSPPGW